MPNPIPKPWKTQLRADRDCVAFYFRDKNPDKPNSYFPTGIPVEFYIRGAVCWPATIGEGVDTATEGFVIVAAQEIKSRKVYVLEARPFLCVDHITNAEGVIQYEGIAPELVRWFARYYCDTYFWHDHSDTHNRYLVQMVRSEMLNPKPWFVEVMWYDDSQARHALYELISQQRFVFFGGENPGKGLVEPLYTALLQMRDSGAVLPAAKAALTLAMGYEKFPWRER